MMYFFISRSSFRGEPVESPGWIAIAIDRKTRLPAGRKLKNNGKKTHKKISDMFQNSFLTFNYTLRQVREQLKRYIIGQFGKEPDRLDEVLDCFRPIHTKRNQVLVEVGDVFQYCYYIVEGCIQTAIYNLNGDESTTDLAFDQDWRTAMRSFLNNQPSNERLVTVQPSKLLAIHRLEFQKLAETIPPFEHLYKGLLEESYTQSVERVQTLMSMDALSRLKWLLEQRPLIFTQLSNKLIASYLGLSQATLSRLKAKL